jgi:hypothetical protein
MTKLPIDLVEYILGFANICPECIFNKSNVRCSSNAVYSDCNAILCNVCAIECYDCGEVYCNDCFNGSNGRCYWCIAITNEYLL